MRATEDGDIEHASILDLRGAPWVGSMEQMEPKSLKYLHIITIVISKGFNRSRYIYCLKSEARSVRMYLGIYTISDLLLISNGMKTFSLMQ